MLIDPEWCEPGARLVLLDDPALDDMERHELGVWRSRSLNPHLYLPSGLYTEPEGFSKNQGTIREMAGRPMCEDVDFGWVPAPMAHSYGSWSPTAPYAFGVCDTWQQVLKATRIAERPGAYFLHVAPMQRTDQPQIGGWRWLTWGPYIGTREPRGQYLYDEPEIEEVLVFTVFRRS